MMHVKSFCWLELSYLGYQSHLNIGILVRSDTVFWQWLRWVVLNFENFINLLNFWRALNFPVNTPILHVVLPDC